MKSAGTKIAYEVIRSHRKTGDIVIERDGKVRAATKEAEPARSGG